MSDCLVNHWREIVLAREVVGSNPTPATKKSKGLGDAPPKPLAFLSENSPRVLPGAGLEQNGGRGRSTRSKRNPRSGRVRQAEDTARMTPNSESLP